MHEIRSGLDGEVVKVYKREGEAAKQAEPLFRVASFDRLRVEGLCKVSQAGSLRVGLAALVEPEVLASARTRLSGHTAPIQALAVSPDGKMLASAGEDRTVILWSWPHGLRLAQLRHPAEVFALAFSPIKGAGYQLLTGCGDGQLRLWACSPEGRCEEPTAFEKAHDSAVRSVAWSADGKLIASGGEDRRVGLWDPAGGKHLHWLQDGDTENTAHQGVVTCVRFAADGQLVSAGRDNTLKLWEAGPSGGKLLSSLPGRTGDVAQPGLSPEGNRVLFDHGEELRLLRKGDWATLGTLQSQKQGTFQNLALFSPGGRLLLTGASSGRLQLWKAPPAPEEAALWREASGEGFHRGALAGLGACLSGGSLSDPFNLARGALAFEPEESAGGAPGASPPPRLWPLDAYEVCYFLTPNATMLCGAFSPDGRTVFTAGSDRLIYAWPVPPASRWQSCLEARVTFIGSQVERGTDMVRVRAELPNPAEAARRLRPGTYANLRLYPE
jgi:WD40 repeat protein